MATAYQRQGSSALDSLPLLGYGKASRAALFEAHTAAAARQAALGSRRRYVLHTTCGCGEDHIPALGSNVDVGGNCGGGGVAVYFVFRRAYSCLIGYLFKPKQKKMSNRHGEVGKLDKA